MKLLLIALLLCLTACSIQPAINGAAASLVTGIKAAEDANINLWKLNVCGTPYSAVIRHPEIVPAVKALCLPQGDEANPANLLNAITVPK
jgi:hypothetical protein